MNPIAKIRVRLTKYPQVRVEEDPDHSTALPTDSAGFPVPIKTDNRPRRAQFAVNVKNLVPLATW